MKILWTYTHFRIDLKICSVEVWEFVYIFLNIQIMTKSFYFNNRLSLLLKLMYHKKQPFVEVERISIHSNDQGQWLNIRHKHYNLSFVAKIIYFCTKLVLAINYHHKNDIRQVEGRFFETFSNRKKTNQRWRVLLW